MVQKGRWNNHRSYHKVGKDSNHWLKRRHKSFWKGWRSLDRRWIHWVCHWVCLEWSKGVVGIITGAITRLARTPTSGPSVVGREFLEGLALLGSSLDSLGCLLERSNGPKGLLKYSRELSNKANKTKFGSSKSVRKE
jgi:hypothetical protein